MYVNPFWFGVLVTLVVEIMALIVIALVKFDRFEIRDEDDENKT